TGANYKGLSPFREERTPSFVVSPVKNIFKDFSTGIGGNSITFYMKMNNISFVEAIEELSRKYNITMSKVVRKNDENKSEYNKYYEILSKVENYYVDNLINNKEATKYIENRGFTEEDIKKYNIGFSSNQWDDLYNFLTKEGYGEKELIELGLIKKNENGNIFDVFRNRIMFPIVNSYSKTIGFGGRIIENNENAPKYLNSPDSLVFNKGKELFGLTNRGQDIKKKGFAILMEGYLDVLTSHKYGFNSAVASLGTSLTEDQVILLKKYTNNVVIAYDNDEAGKNAILKAMYIFKKHDFNVKCLVVNDTIKDPDEYLRKRGKKEFTKILKTSIEAFDYLYTEFSKDVDLKNHTAKKGILFKLKDFFSVLSNRIEIDIYINKLSQELSIEKDEIRREFETLGLYKRTKIKKKPETLSIETKRKSKYDILEESTLRLILKAPNKLNKFQEKKFENIIYMDLFEKLGKINFNIDKLKEQEFEEEEEKIIFNLSSEADAKIDNIENYFKDTFVGWFKRELIFSKGESRENQQKYLKLRDIEEELKVVHIMNEIEKLYEEFKLLKESDYV
ncbi:MAG: DNA primase, partial [Leptotrichiaceae bacterium]|nr:DNA primase [Leptotrichiaceae bacterium]